MTMTHRFVRRVAAVSTAATLLAAGSAAAVVGLPANQSQVNNDPAVGIDPAQNAGVSDIVGGSLAAGGARVPWATFEQAEPGGAQRIFVRAFKNGQWVTQGPSLNIDQNVEAEAPSIDFAGAGRTVPWDAWYEPSKALGGEKQIFASRFAAATNTWQPEGQDRGSGIPSLNIHTDKEAENPSVAGGAAVAGDDPVPWVAWEEQDGAANTDQIFVSKGVKQAAPQSPCTGFKPSDAKSVSNFCWQQVGLDRLAEDGGSDATGDPTLNVDPTRNGVEPDIAFTGPSDTVAWTVWYEKDKSGLGLRDNEQVFAARIVADPKADGGFSWRAVGNGTQGQLNTARHDRRPTVRQLRRLDDRRGRVLAEQGRRRTTPRTRAWPRARWCRAARPSRGSRGPRRTGQGLRLAPGRRRPLRAVQRRQPDLARPAPTPPAGHHVLRQHAVRVLERVARRQQARLRRALRRHRRVRQRHPGGIRLNPFKGGPTDLIDARVPLSSSCTADPFTKDGTACTPGDVNAPFYTFTTAGCPQRLFAQSAIGGPNCVIFYACKVQVPVHHHIARHHRQAAQAADGGHPGGARARPVASARSGACRSARTTRAERPRWNLKVNGHRLHRGKYRVTLRALDSHRNILGLTKPVNDPGALEVLRPIPDGGRACPDVPCRTCPPPSSPAPPAASDSRLARALAERGWRLVIDAREPTRSRRRPPSWPAAPTSPRSPATSRTPSTGAGCWPPRAGRST